MCIWCAGTFDSADVILFVEAYRVLRCVNEDKVCGKFRSGPDFGLDASRCKEDIAVLSLGEITAQFRAIRLNLKLEIVMMYGNVA